MGEKKPEYAGRLLSHDLHLADLEIPGESTWAGKTLMELNLGKKYGIHIASILRGPLGASKLILGSCAVLDESEFIETPAPGRIAPPI